MRTDTIPVSLTTELRQSSARKRGTGSTETHEAGLAGRAFNVLARGVKNFLGLNSSREVGVMLAKPSLAA